MPQGAAISREEKKVENKEVRILVVDDEPTMADSLRQNFVEEGYSVDTAATGAAAIELFDQGGHHLAICDLQLPDMDGLEVLRHMKDARPTTEVIVVTGYGSVQKAVEATKAGAFYFVEKPFDFEELQPLVEKALERRELVAETANMRRQLSTRAEYFNIIGSSKPMQTIYETIESVAKSDANVLIVGESGTGKELIANAIHYQSLRSKKPFIKVNCAALPKELIESELFGHTKGAFTGAHADKEGLVQHAAGGSLMLDEIAEMPVELQPKLLRVLQERSYRKIGSEKTYAVDFRLVCSTNRPPADAIRDGLLRDDLFYRISTITIHVPPLRERNEDIQLLTEHFLHMYAQKYERPITGVSQAAYQRLFGHTLAGQCARAAKRDRARGAARERQTDRADRSAFRQRHAAGRNVGKCHVGRATQHDARRHRAARDRTNSATNRGEQAGSGKSPGDLPAASLQQDQEVQYRRAVIGFSIIASATDGTRRHEMIA